MLGLIALSRSCIILVLTNDKKDMAKIPGKKYAVNRSMKLWLTLLFFFFFFNRFWLTLVKPSYEDTLPIGSQFYLQQDKTNMMNLFVICENKV